MTKEKKLEKINRAIEYFAWLEQIADDNDEPKEFSDDIIGMLKQLKTMVLNISCPKCQPQLEFAFEYATDDVPWKRNGHVGFNPKEGQDWGKAIPNTGISRKRLVDDTVMIERHFASDTEERAFAMLWDYQNNKDHGKTILDLIFTEEPVSGLIRDEVDRLLVMLTAQSIIQWLGTNCGSAFINQARDIAKKDKKRIEEETRFLDTLSED